MSRRAGDFQTMLEQTRQRVQQTRRMFYHQAMDGDISRELHRELAKRVLEYNDMLSELKTLDGADPTDFPDVSEVKQRLGEQTEVVTASPRLGEKRTTRTVPSVVEIPAGRLVRMTNELDAVAQQLGFGADADVEPPAGPHGDM